MSAFVTDCSRPFLALTNDAERSILNHDRHRVHTTSTERVTASFATCAASTRHNAESFRHETVLSIAWLRWRRIPSRNMNLLENSHLAFPIRPAWLKGISTAPRRLEATSLLSTSVIIKFVALLRVISGGREIRCAGTLIIPLIKTAGRRGGKRNRDRHHSEKSFSGKEFLQPCLLRYLDGCFVQETGGRSGENIKAPSEGN